MNDFIQSDFEFTLQEVAMLGDKERKWAELHCRISDDGFTFYVGSQRNIHREHEVWHDDLQPIHCSCEWATYHKHICKPHFWRVAQVLNKRKARVQAEESQRKVAVLPASRMGNYLTKRPGFNFLRTED